MVRTLGRFEGWETTEAVHYAKQELLVRLVLSAYMAVHTKEVTDGFLHYDNQGWFLSVSRVPVKGMRPTLKIKRILIWRVTEDFAEVAEPHISKNGTVSHYWYKLNFNEKGKMDIFLKDALGNEEEASYILKQKENIHERRVCTRKPPV